MSDGADPRGERGSIIIAVGVMFVATSLIVSMVTMTDFGLRSSRRAGDSANALQVADAGVNDAVRRAASVAGTTFSDTRSLGSAGSYSFTATKDPTEELWHIDAVGTDATGVRRRIRADAAPESIFANALFGQSAIQLGAGVAVDSYRSGTSSLTTCTGRGYVGTNSAATFSSTSSGGGGGVTNCGGTYRYDGCISYADSTPVPDIPASAQCPTPVRKVTPKFPLPTITGPTGAPVAQPGGECTSDSSTWIPSGTHYWTSLKMRDGCRVALNAAGDPAEIYVTGGVEVGEVNGQGGSVNAPVGGSGGCPTSGGGYDVRYCPGWPAKLQVNVVSGTSGVVCFNANNTEFWGVIAAPDRSITRCGSGGAQFEIWGAVLANTVDSHAQFALHYDESLASLTNGRYVTKNWREEPLS